MSEIRGAKAPQGGGAATVNLVLIGLATVLRRRKTSLRPDRGQGIETRTQSFVSTVTRGGISR